MDERLDAAADSAPAAAAIATFSPARWLPLGALAHGRDNNFQLLRFLAATAVILFHAYALTDHWTDEPLWKLAPEVDFGSLGVKCFFVMSGFLVTQSWLAHPRLAAFAAARALRIYPALIAATLFSVVLASWSNPLPFDEFMAWPAVRHFIVWTSTGLGARDQITGVYASNPFPNAVNGSLWTLPIELRLYIVLAVAGVAGLLSRKYAWAFAVAALIALFAVKPEWFPLYLNTKATRELALLFALGSLAYVWRDAIPVSLAGLALGLALLIVNPGGVGRGVLLPPLLTYVLLTLAYHPMLQWPAFNGLGDYSYGLYVYSFPIQQTVVRMMPEAGPALVFAIAMFFTLIVAALSWHLLERPLLGLKSRFR